MPFAIFLPAIFSKTVMTFLSSVFIFRQLLINPVKGVSLDLEIIVRHPPNAQHFLPIIAGQHMTDCVSDITAEWCHSNNRLSAVSIQ